MFHTHIFSACERQFVSRYTKWESSEADGGKSDCNQPLRLLFYDTVLTRKPPLQELWFEGSKLWTKCINEDICGTKVLMVFRDIETQDKR